MIKVIRTDSDNADFRALVARLDEYLAMMDGAEHSFYAQFNKLDKIKNAVVAYADETAVGCGAFKELEPETVEIKRMFVREENRKQGIAGFVLAELEAWAKELKYKEAVLETGQRQTEAAAFYKKKRLRIYSELRAIRGRGKQRLSEKEIYFLGCEFNRTP